MAENLLVRPLVDAAKVLVKLLVKEGMPIRAAFLHHAKLAVPAFLRNPRFGEHDLIVLVTPLVDEHGSVPVYRRVRSVLDQHPEVRLTLSEMSIVGERDAVYQELRQLPAIMPFPHDVVFARPDFSPYVPYVSEDEEEVSIHVFYWHPTEYGEQAPPEQPRH